MPTARPGLLLGVLLALAAGWLLAGYAIRTLQPEAVLPADFYPPERNSEFSYRFAKPLATLLLPASPAGTRLVLRAFSPAPLPARALAVAAFEQGALFQIELGGSPRVLRLLLPPGDPQQHGLALSLRTESATAAGDARALGLLYTDMHLEGPAPTFPWLRLAATLVPPLLGALVLAVGFGPLAAGMATLLLALLAIADQSRLLIYAGALAAALLIGRSGSARFNAIAARVRGLRLLPVAWAALSLGLLGAAWLGFYALANHRLYGTNTYDLGLYDQTFWLLSRGLPNYSSGAGINMVGSHAALVLFPLSLLYWLLPDVRLLLLVQSLAVGLAAVPLYLFGRDRGAAWLGVAAGAAYLLHPATQNAALFDFHVDTLAATALLFALWAADRRRWRIVLICCGIVLACKENFAFVIALLGLLLVARRDWRVGLLLIAASAAWFLFATQLLVPGLIGREQSLHVGRFAKYGDSVSAILLTAVTRPQIILADMFPPDAPTYLAALLAPLALLPVLSPYALVALPSLAINLLSNVEGQRSVLFHYSALVVAAIAIAALHSACWLSHTIGRRLRPSHARRRTAQALLGAALVGAALLAQSAAPLRRDEIDAAIVRDAPTTRYYDYLLGLIPPTANVSAQSRLQPQLTHRQQAFMFPNPFIEAEFFNAAGLPFTPAIDYVIYDTRLFDRIGVGPEQKRALLDELRARGLYEEIGRIEGIVLLRRADTELPARCFGAGWAACRAEAE